MNKIAPSLADILKKRSRPKRDQACGSVLRTAATMVETRALMHCLTWLLRTGSMTLSPVRERR